MSVRGPPRDLIVGNRANKGDLLRNNIPNSPGDKSNNTITQISFFMSIEFNASYITLSVVIVVLHIISILVLIKCKRLSYQIKYFSVNYLLANTIYHMSNTIYTLNIYMSVGRTSWATVLQRQLMTFVSGVSWCSMALLAVERILALRLSIKYALIVTKKKVIATVACIWSLNFAIALSTLFGTVVECNGWTLTACSPNGNTKRNRAFAFEKKVAMIVFVIYSIVLLLAIVKLHSIIKRHVETNSRLQAGGNTAIRKSDRQKTSRFILKLQVMHILLHIPVVAYFIAFELQLNHGVGTFNGLWIRRISDLSLAVHSFFTLGLYTWNFRECRLVLLTLFCSCCTCGRNRLRKMQNKMHKPCAIKSNENLSKKTTKSSQVAISGQKTTKGLSEIRDQRY